MVRISRRQHCRISINCSLYAFVCAMVVVPGLAADSLFNGTTFDGWEGDINDVWRIENKEIVGGSLSKKQERNNFLCTTNRFTNFDLKLRIKLSGTKGFINSGIQFRSERVRGSHEVAGYQADFGAGHDGALYDESRRKKFLARPPESFLEGGSQEDEWHDYRIRARGNHIELWVDGIQTVDYTEVESGLPSDGIIGLQIHGNGVAEVRFKDLVIEELP